MRHLKIQELTKSQLRELFFEDGFMHFDVVQKEITDTSRWSIHYSLVVKDQLTGQYFETMTSIGATEQQDEAPFEYIEAVWVEVVPKEKTIIEYVPV